ncbi:MAG TPA: gephyrin-like molybdotransferase Glp [Minicystis sp.]|nr:gephyrin-like molybdotransferase Glp [Minicystis sp.]
MRDVRMRGFRARTPVADALLLLEARTGPLAAERVALAEADGRVAAEDVAAEVSVPHFARAAMDGFALRGESTFGASTQAPATLALVGASMPGRPFDGDVGPGEAVSIATGAPLPRGADAVLMAEHAEERDGGRTRRVVLAFAPVAPKRHVGAAGEDIEVGARVVAAGRRLRPQDLGVLASVGVAEIAVVRRPRVRVLVTGDEILAPGARPDGARIVDANGPMLAALARRDGAARVDVVRAPDRRDAVRAAIADAECDVVLVSGGSSVGPEDHAPVVLAELGELLVHGVAMRPASPAGFGFVGARPVFLLPGNPVSCLAAYEFFAGPTIRALGGRRRAWPHPRVRGVLAAKIASELGRTDYVRVALDGGRVTPIMTSGASILSSTTRADGVVLVPADREGHAEGEAVEVLLYDAP